MIARGWVVAALFSAAMATSAQGARASEAADACAGKFSRMPDDRIAGCTDLLREVQSNPEKLANTYLTLSTLSLGEGSDIVAEQYVEAALKAWPSGAPELLADRGNRFRSKGDYDHAQADLERANRAAPHSYRTLYYFAELQMVRGKIPLAAQWVDAALEARPGDPIALTLKSEISAAGGDVDSALSILDGLIAQAPTYTLYNSRCYIRAVADRQVAEKALPDCNKALQLSPNRPEILDSRGLADLRLGRYAQAVADYSAAISASDGPVPTSLYGRGLAEQQMGNRMSATSDITAAEAVSPGIQKTFGTLAMLTQ